jgi:hypothetical protein
MKTLTEYVNESLVQEAFSSDIFRDFFRHFRDKARRGHRVRWAALQWDKIKDSDLVKLTKDEALKRMRSRKDPGYLLWVSERGFPRTGWPRDRKDTFSYNGITYGWDVIMSYDGSLSINANNIADTANYAYEVVDPQRFFCKEMQVKRREAREGALALKDPEKVKEENLQRYKEALAKMHTPEASTLVSKLEEIAEMYKNVMDKYVTHFAGKMQEDTPSYVMVSDLLSKINSEFLSIMRSMANIKNYSEARPDWANNYYKDFNNLVQRLEKLINDYMSKAE